MEKFKKAMNESPIFRWGVLLLVGFVLMTNYYFYDAFSTLKDQLTENFGFSNTDYGLFSAIYSFPNLIMAVIGGIILDRVGIRKTGFLFVFSMAIGALITAYGSSNIYGNGGIGYGFMQTFLANYTPELKMMLLGRFFYGLGAETSIVVVSKILVKWFKGKDLALAFGLKVGFGRLGSFLALRFSPIFSNDGTTLSLAVWIAALLVAMGLLVFIVYMLFDLRYDKQTVITENNADEKSKFTIKDIGDLLSNRAYIYIALLCVTFYSAVFPFVQFAPDFIKDKFEFTAVQSGEMISWLPLATLIFTPTFGFLVDRYGRSGTLMIFGSLALLFSHLLFGFTYVSPYIPLVLLGIAFALVPATMWPSMVKMVDDKKIGTAYGLMYSIQNVGLLVFPILAGKILDYTNPDDAINSDYTMTIAMFAFLGILGLVFALMMKREDKRNGYGIDLPLNKK